MFPQSEPDTTDHLSCRNFQCIRKFGVLGGGASVSVALVNNNTLSRYIKERSPVLSILQSAIAYSKNAALFQVLASGDRLYNFNQQL